MRGQVNYDPGVQGMEQVNPIAFQPVRAHLDDTAGLKANQLAQALGSSAIPRRSSSSAPLRTNRSGRRPRTQPTP